jgi:glucose-1-phosphate thymidylyltransferase
MIEHLLDQLAPISGIEEFVVVTNATFAGPFEQWASRSSALRPSLRLTIVNDGSISNETKLGAIGDLHLVLTREKADDDWIVIAGDNLFSHGLEGFGRFCREKNSPVVGVYDVGDPEEAKKHNALELDGEGRITFFQEKAPQPSGTLIAIALYYYPRAVLPLLGQYMAEGNNPDQPGRLIQWLYPRLPVYTWRVPGIWFDIGSKDNLEQANRLFARQ